MKKIEIVAHCYCPPGLTHYAQMLKWQWASFVNYPPSDCVVDYTVCYTQEDQHTKDQIADCMSWDIDNVYLRPVALRPRQLFRRAIGRNLRALNTNADVIWMTDVDYLFGNGCLDDVIHRICPDSRLSMPASYWINNDHETGDKMLAFNETVRHPFINPNLFTRKKQRIAIGGLQILGGNFARDVGYLNGTKYVNPVSEHEGFRSCKCDRWFRQHNKLKAKRVEIQNIYRIRHTEAGRDYFLTGDKGDGKEAW